MSNAVLLPLWGEPVRRHQTLEAASRGPGEVQQGRARDLEDRSSLGHGKVVYGYVYAYDKTPDRMNPVEDFMRTRANLVRKQYLVSEENIKKVERLARSKGTSAADIVRQAIEAYEPQGGGDMEAPELMQLVHERLKEAITTTRRANRKVANALKSLEAPKA